VLVLYSCLFRGTRKASLEVAPTTLSNILADRENMALLLVYGFKLVFTVAD